MIVILDNIRSLHNVGSIFRTADAVGVEKLYLCGITPSPLDRFGVVRGDVAKVSLGAEKTVPWESVVSTSRLITSLKKQGFTIVALEQDVRAVTYYEYAKTWIASSTRKDKGVGGIALILGAEVEGVSPAVLKKCDTIIEIPMKGKKESLNVAVAFGVAAFRLRDSGPQ
jgi:tRNA G18 (ribose-2'-O)-methylase SpoU